MWFERIKRVQLTAISLISYHFSGGREMEKVTRPTWIYGQNAEYQPSGSARLPFGYFFLLFRRRRQWSTKTLCKPGRQRHQYPRDQRCHHQITRPVHPQQHPAARTPVAQTSKIAIVRVRRRGHSSPTPSSAQLAANIVCPEGNAKPVSFCQCLRKRSGYPAVLQAAPLPTHRDLYALNCRTHPPEHDAFFPARRRKDGVPARDP